MSALLYILYSSELSEEDKLIIDKSVFENREAVCIFARNIPSNVKDNTKRLISVISLATVVYFSGLESVEAIGLPMDYGPNVKCLDFA